MSRDGGGNSPRQRRNIESDDTLFTAKYVATMTPRSKEACQMLGVLPKELVIKSFDSFQKPGISPEIAQLRYRDYEQLRQETIHMVRQQRRDLVQSGWTPNPPNDPSSSRAGFLPPAHSNGQELVLHSSRSERSLHGPTNTLEMEQLRMQKIMKRQNKELEAMMAYEVKMAEMVARQEKKLLYRREREAELREQRKLERFKMAEKRRLWELAKKEEEEKEQKKREEAALKLLAQEKKRAEEAALREIERKKEANKRSLERKKKKMMLERRTQQILEEQFQLMEMKNREMQERDAQRRKIMEEKKRELSALHLEKTRKARARVATVLDDKERMLEEKRALLQEKMSRQAHRMEEFERMKIEEAKAHQKRIQIKEEQRQQLLAEARQKERDRVESILRKKALHEQHKREIDMKRRDKMEFRAELQRLNRSRKEKNVARLKRMENYKRLLLIEKVNEDSRRTRLLEEQKNQLLLERQRNKIAVTRQKQELMQMFDKIKSSRNINALSRMLQIEADPNASNQSGSSTPTRNKGGKRRSHAGMGKSQSSATLKEFFGRMQNTKSSTPTGKGRRRRKRRN